MHTSNRLVSAGIEVYETANCCGWLTVSHLCLAAMQYSFCCSSYLSWLAICGSGRSSKYHCNKQGMAHNGPAHLHFRQ